jgi:hypothetical protein
MTAVLSLLKPPATAMVRSARAWLYVCGWILVAAVSAEIAHRARWSQGADLVLGGVYGTVSLPLMAYTLVGAALEGGPLAAAAHRVASLGASAFAAQAMTLAVAAVSCAWLGSSAAAAVAMLAHGTGDPPVAGDVMASALVGALGGLAYCAWFALGASFGSKGGGRFFLLVLDWVIGSGDGGLAVVSPRGHVRNLLGGAPPFRWSERASACSLVLLTIAWTCLSLWRARRSRSESSTLRPQALSLLPR